MNLLFPGRHHLLTDFQFKYLYHLVQNGLHDTLDVDQQPLEMDGKIERIIFAVTSANHSNTRRNPVPFHLRAMAILDFSQELGIPSFVYPIDDVGYLDDFAGYTLKKIRHDSDGALDLTPENTLVACSSPVMNMYEKMGFRILPVELANRHNWEMRATSPWDLVEMIGRAGKQWGKDRQIFDRVHKSSYLIWSQYGLGEKVERLFSDDMIGADGDLTESRDYGSYVRQMDEIAQLKYQETAPFIRPGRIGDIGCAVGTWIKLAARDPRFRESEFFGIEVAQQLYRICLQRKENGEFPHPYIFFSQKNAVTELCFEPNSMDTIHTSSLTHEIESYGDRQDLHAFIRKRCEELAPGGVWVNRDVVGPDEKERIVLLKLNAADGRNEDWEQNFEERDELKNYLAGLSTRALFLRFARDFRAGEDYEFAYRWVEIDGGEFAELRLDRAMEFISKKDYHSNWASEMHETFCFWNFADWQRELEEAGFILDRKSRAYTNKWLVENRYAGKAELYEVREGDLRRMSYPVTHTLIVAEKRI